MIMSCIEGHLVCGKNCRHSGKDGKHVLLIKRQESCMNAG